MATNPYIGWVNLQMVSVRHHLSLLLDENNANDRLRNRGVLQSGAWHLKRAYQYYLYELGANYQLPSPEDNATAEALSRALESIGKHPGEAAELAALEDNGWVGDLLGAVTNIDKSDSEPLSSARADGLQLLDLDSVSAPLTLETLNEWLGKFKELINRHREVMVEY